MAQGIMIGSGGGGGSSKGIPQFTYTGDYQVLDDGEDNWRIKFFTSGVLTFKRLGNAKNGIDVFCVGGGGGGGYSNGGGGGGGYTTTQKNVVVAAKTEYPIEIGSGGAYSTSASARGNDGSQTSAFRVTANGGRGGGTSSRYGGDGGSGGGGYHSESMYGGVGGTDGGDGTRGNFGKGQGTTTREFGEPDGTLYSGGGAGNQSGKRGDETAGIAVTSSTADSPDIHGVTNRGGGGGGANTATSLHGGNGGSGIVVIRNARG